MRCYQNASEVLREGLRIVEQREAEDAARLKALRDAAQVGINALERGDFKEFESPDALVNYLHGLSTPIIDNAAKSA